MNADSLRQKLKVALQTHSADLYVPYACENNRGIPCSVEGCRNLAYAKGLCNAHYLRARAGRPLDAPLQHRNRKLVCSECSDPVDCKGGWGLCKPHYRLKRRQTIRRLCVEALGDACRRCGASYPDRVYDFHHRDRHSKISDPSDLIDNASLAVIAEEVAKCDLLCANCHRLEHDERSELREST